MLISDLLSPERIRCDVQSSSKKRLLELISEELARDSEEFSKREIFESLCARERLGSTGLGNGVAIPHGRIKGSQSCAGIVHPAEEAGTVRLPWTVSRSTCCSASLCRKTVVKTISNYWHRSPNCSATPKYCRGFVRPKPRRKLLQLLSGARH